jgi:hypothetical protein
MLKLKSLRKCQKTIANYGFYCYSRSSNRRIHRRVFTVGNHSVGVSCGRHRLLFDYLTERGGRCLYVRYAGESSSR